MITSFVVLYGIGYIGFHILIHCLKNVWPDVEERFCYYAILSLFWPLLSVAMIVAAVSGCIQGYIKSNKK